MLCALIMAGGKGTRFWPLSTEKKPKQFLNLICNETMIQITVNRIKKLIPIERIFICTGAMYVDLVKDQISEIPRQNIIVEPEGRNTTPCIALSAFVINRYYKNSNMLVLPSDHLIKDESEFRNIVKNADEFINENNNSIITLGMSPVRAETGYGYIKFGENKKQLNKNEIIKVEAFVEKPNKETAKRYLEEGNYLWNGGIFLWSINSILNKIKAYSVNTYEALQGIKYVSEDKLQVLIDDNYKNTEAISIDYAVLEKSNDIYVVPSDIGWDDIGSLEALDRYRQKDKYGNVNVGNTSIVNGQNNLIISSNQRVIVEGLNDIFLIENDGKIIVGKKDNISNIKELKQIV